MPRPKAAYGIAHLSRKLNLHPRWLKEMLEEAHCPIRRKGRHLVVWLSDLRQQVPHVLETLLELETSGELPAWRKEQVERFQELSERLEDVEAAICRSRVA